MGSTVNNLSDALAMICREVRGSHITLEVQDDFLRVNSPSGSFLFQIVKLNRPSSADIERSAAPDRILVLTGATQKAVHAARQYNHLLIPQGGYRLIAPGVALFQERPLGEQRGESRRVKFSGRSGVVIESLLLSGTKPWSVQELARDAQVSPALAHRVLNRLEEEGLVDSHGRGHRKLRFVTNTRSLAETWSEEEGTPTVVAHGFLYASSLEALARRVFEWYPAGAVGGLFAANRYKPVLTRVNPPLQIWVGSDFAPDSFAEATGFERTDSGVNVEFVRTKESSWLVHLRKGDLPMVSPWRAWREIAKAKGRTEELATELITDLEKQNHGSY